MTLALRQMHVGDCRELLAQMADESVNCVVTSPPYWGLRDYGTGSWEGGDDRCSHTYKPGGTDKSTLPNYANGLTLRVIEDQMAERGHATYRSVCGKCGARRTDRQIGLEEGPQDYVAKMVLVFRELRRVLRRDGTLWLNLGDTYAQGGRGRIGDASTLQGTANSQNESRRPAAQRPIDGLKPKDLVGIPWRVAFALQADGWWLRSDIVWAKPNPMPESVTDRPSKAHEYLFLMSRSATYYYDANAIKEAVTGNAHPRGAGVNPKAEASGFKTKQNASFSAAVTGLVNERNKRSVWSIPTEPYDGAHFATFPRKLVEPCILAGCPMGGVVLDPFGGSGTVGQVAEELGRNWILFDLNPEYAELAAKRTAQRGLFVEAVAK